MWDGSKGFNVVDDGWFVENTLLGWEEVSVSSWSWGLSFDGFEESSFFSCNIGTTSKSDFEFDIGEFGVEGLDCID
jgi:hypothetical protein